MNMVQTIIRTMEYLSKRSRSGRNLVKNNFDADTSCVQRNGRFKTKSGRSCMAVWQGWKASDFSRERYVQYEPWPRTKFRPKLLFIKTQFICVFVIQSDVFDDSLLRIYNYCEIPYLFLYLSTLIYIHRIIIMIIDNMTRIFITWRSHCSPIE